MNSDMEKTIKNHVCLEFQQSQPIDQMILHEVAGTTWEVLDIMFQIKDKHFLKIEEYFSIFPIPIVKNVESLSATCFLLCYKFVFAAYSLLKKKLSKIWALILFKTNLNIFQQT